MKLSSNVQIEKQIKADADYIKIIAMEDKKMTLEELELWTKESIANIDIRLQKIFDKSDQMVALQQAAESRELKDRDTFRDRWIRDAALKLYVYSMVLNREPDEEPTIESLVAWAYIVATKLWDEYENRKGEK